MKEQIKSNSVNYLISIRNEIARYLSSKEDATEIYNAYLYGSPLYGTSHIKSDYDIIIVGDNIKSFKTDHDDPLYNITVYTIDQFKELLHAHDPIALECYFAPLEARIFEPYLDFIFDFKLDIHKLRHSFGAVVSNSWVKAKKKIQKEDEVYIGKKSLYHVLRILNYGTQLAIFGEIKNFEYSKLYFNIMNYSDNWDELKAEFDSVRKHLLHLFRTVAPKF